MTKFILHVDMDCFFAAVEIRENPELVDKPVIVGADPKKGQGRGVVTTCSTEARTLGLHSAMPISRAYKLCPQGVYVHPRFSLYKEVSQNIMNTLRSYTEKFQQMSIDEAYLDISDQVNNIHQAAHVAKTIQQHIASQENLSCSVGVSTNKLVAKIASDFDKPQGLTVVVPGKEQEFLHPLEIRKMHGVGPKTELKLKKIGVRTIGDLALLKKDTLMKRFGLYGYYLHTKSQGKGNDVVYQGHGRSSLGHERTFREDTSEEKRIHDTLHSLSELISKRLHKEEYHAKTITLKIRFSDFTTLTRSITVQTPTQDPLIVLSKSLKLYNEFKEKKVRLIGLRVTNLEKKKGQVSLLQY